jgi:hypothetical protein
VLLRSAEVVQLLAVAQEAVQVYQLVQGHLPRSPRCARALPGLG